MGAYGMRAVKNFEGDAAACSPASATTGGRTIDAPAAARTVTVLARCARLAPALADLATRSYVRQARYS